jgi:hypothetical protein
MGKVVIEKKTSAMQDFMQELPGLLVQFANAEKERKFREDQLQSQHELNLAANLQASNLQLRNQKIQQRDSLRQTLSEKNIIVDSLNNLKGVDSSGSGASILEESIGSTKNQLEAENMSIESLNDEISTYTSLIAAEGKGRDAYNAAVLGGYDFDGNSILSIDEINNFVSTEGKNYNLTEPQIRAFKAGMSSQIPTAKAHQELLTSIAQRKQIEAESVKSMMGFEDIAALKAQVKETAKNSEALLQFQVQNAETNANKAEFEYDTLTQAATLDLFNQSLTTSIVADNSFGKAMALSVTPVVITSGWREDARAYGVDGSQQDQEAYPLVSMVMETDAKARKDNLEKIRKNYDYVGDDILDMVTTLTFGFNPSTGEYDYTLFNEKMKTIYDDYVDFNSINIDVETDPETVNYLNQMMTTYGSSAETPDAREILQGPTDISSYLDRSFFKYSRLYEGKWSDKEIASGFVNMVESTYGYEMGTYAEKYLRFEELRAIGILSNENIETLAGLSRNRDKMMNIRSEIGKVRTKGGQELQKLIQGQKINKYDPSGSLP